MPVPFKRVVFRLHQIFGLAAALVLLLVALSGCLLAFRDELIDMLNPQWEIPAQGREPLSPDALVATLHAAQPGFVVAGFTWNGAARAVEVRSPGRGPGVQRVLLDPYTGQSLPPARGVGFFADVERFHKTLLLGPFGKQLTGAATLGVLLLIATGLIQRWPRQPRSARAWLKVDGRLRGRSALRQWHLILGTWLLVPQLLTVATGLWWSYDLYRNVVNAWAGVPARVTQARPDAGERSGTREREASSERAVPPPAAVTLDPVWSAFTAAVPTSRRAMIALPRAADATVEVRYLEAGAPHSRALGSASFGIDGTLKSLQPYTDQSAGRRLVASMYALHSGEWLGLGGRLVMLLSALGMAFFAVSGIWMWLWRRRLLARSTCSTPTSTANETAPNSV